jgi:hypothetical protein
MRGSLGGGVMGRRGVGMGMGVWGGRTSERDMAILYDTT